MNFLENITTPNLKLGDLKHGKVYFIVQDRVEKPESIVGTFMYAVDDKVVFESSPLTFWELKIADYNLTSSGNTSMSFIFGDAEEALYYFDYLTEYRKTSKIYRA